MDPYRLIVLTHGEGETLDETLQSFEAMVSPDPTSVTVFRDDGSHGFCGNVRRAWADAAVLNNVHYIFWLEHDFRFIRSLDLEPLSGVLEAHADLAQMSLMRDAVNELEKEAGGLYEFHEALGNYEHPVYVPSARASFLPFEGSKDNEPWYEWLAHRICLTTNPSLMRRQFMAENPWPAYSSRCEGRFSEDLRQRGYWFGTWGSGEVYVEHTGKLRTGHGY